MINNSHLHRERLRPWFTGACLGICVLAAGAALGPGDASTRWTLAAILGLFCGIVLFAAYRKALRRDLGLKALLADPWVHWRYSEDQWTAWKTAEKARLDAQVRAYDVTKPIVFFVLFMLAVSALIGLGASDGKDSTTLIAILAAPLTCGFAFLLWYSKRMLRVRMERVAASPPEAWLGAEGIFLEGEFSPLTAWEYHLTAAAISENPLHRLILCFAKRDGKSWTDVIRSVPIPEGADADLPRLQSQLQEKCSKAVIQIAPPAARQ